MVNTGCDVKESLFEERYLECTEAVDRAYHVVCGSDRGSFCVLISMILRKRHIDDALDICKYIYT